MVTAPMARFATQRVATGFGDFGDSYGLGSIRPILTNDRCKQLRTLDLLQETHEGAAKPSGFAVPSQRDAR